MSVLFCDTNCELWYDKAEQLGLKVIRMPYTLDGKEYFYDLGKNTDFDYFYRRMREKSMPTTAALNEYDYIDYFEPYFKEGKDIFYITFSHQLSGTFEFMNKAIEQLKQKYPERKITIYNSKSISMGAGYIVYYAAKKWAEGATDEELIKYLDYIRKHTELYFAVNDLFHLKRGGRLSGAAATVGTLLGVKPIISINSEGKLVPVYKEKGIKKVISRFCSLIKEQGGEFEKYDIYVLDADCKDDGEMLAQKIREEIGDCNIIRQTIGPVVATHCGPGTLGVVYFKK